MMRGTISDAGLHLNASLDGNNRKMDENRECVEFIDSREISDVYANSLTYL